MHTSTVIVTPRVLPREGIASLLESTQYKVVASAARPAELSLSCCPKRQPTLAILEIDPQNGNLDEVAASIRLLRSLMPNGKVVLIAADTGGRIDLQRVLAFSPDACIFNLGSRDILIKILELTFMDQRVFVLSDLATTASGSRARTASNDHDVHNSARDSSNSHQRRTNGHTLLSPREHQVLLSIAEGKSNKVIARQHNVTESTVKVHLKAILRKLNKQNRTQAAIWAIENGFRIHFQNTVEVCSPTHPAQRQVGQPAKI
jgi:two-component system, NarL family, nitrate/nitrite response regulator NarL